VSAIERFLVIFPSIVYEAIPFIILGALISGTLEEFLPQRWITRFLPRWRPLAVAGGACLGLVFPMCECGIVPVMRRLLSKGLPLSCAVAYMLAAPIINPVVIGSTWAAFSGNRSGLDGLTSLEMVSLRVSLAFLTAVTVGLIIDRLQRRHGLEGLIKPVHRAHTHTHYHGHNPSHGEHNHGTATAEAKKADANLETVPIETVHDAAATPELEKKTLGQRLIRISETALHDFIDITCFLVLGAAIASVVQTFRVLDYAPALSESSLLAAPAMMLLAVLLCLCSEADAFVAANLIKIPLSGKIAFLVLGPMLDLKLFFMYTRVFRYRLIWPIIISVVICVFVLSLAAPYLDAGAQQAWQYLFGGSSAR
jgi:uncharacterized membrane protein YraQ (UPF0718 family)